VSTTTSSARPRRREPRGVIYRTDTSYKKWCLSFARFDPHVMGSSRSGRQRNASSSARSSAPPRLGFIPVAVAVAIESRPTARGTGAARVSRVVEFEGEHPASALARQLNDGTGWVAGDVLAPVREDALEFSRFASLVDRYPATLLRQDGAVAPWGAVSGRWRRVVGACASVVGCRGAPGRATYGGRRP